VRWRDQLPFVRDEANRAEATAGIQPALPISPVQGDFQRRNACDWDSALGRCAERSSPAVDAIRFGIKHAHIGDGVLARGDTMINPKFRIDCTFAITQIGVRNSNMEVRVRAALGGTNWQPQIVWHPGWYY
jgi:hypothetical protein